jgi:hypothetical protein
MTETFQQLATGQWLLHGRLVLTHSQPGIKLTTYVVIGIDTLPQPGIKLTILVVMPIET